METKRSYEELKQGVESHFAERVQSLEAEIRALEEERRAKLKWLEEIWSASRGNMSPIATTEERQEPAEAQEEDVADSNGAKHRSTAGGSVPRYTRSVRRPATDRIRDILDEIEDEIVTQPLIRERFVEKYPGSDSNSLASAIAHILKEQVKFGKLELIEEGRAGVPNKYRKVKTEAEVNFLGP